MTDEEIQKIEDRAAQAARRADEGFFTSSIVRVAGFDVPLLIAEIRRLRAAVPGGKS